MAATAAGWVSAFALVVVGPLLLHAYDHSRARALGLRVALGDEWSPFSAGLLTGGPRRAVDAVITGLVERGVLAARAGVLTRVTAGRSLWGLERAVVESVGRGARLSDLRLSAVLADKRPFLVVYGTFQERGLVVAGGWRRFAGTAVWSVLLCGGAVALLVVLSGVDTIGGVGPAAGLLALLVVPVVLLALRPGRLGDDPRTALGHAVSRNLVERATTSLADTVGVGGLAALPDADLVLAILDVEPDGTWGPSTRGTANDLTELNWLGTELIHSRT
ncbi:TIGR04222 domain-containing membrane protein [Actinokineospora bangkokensis]|uniref:TIGR04222 domain-containing membrane protein n=1 Tax=Actinokineospora bangkokensis TaxID=1193682 RepID=A0A1Q9LIW9_9PSEU|nr:TIGR04222 domain-containing membrane protein [Actinokineospora bangkokensis]OLR91978.1 hypothetical protein BJP25_24495 [Actinokineospora bangkokensis]